MKYTDPDGRQNDDANNALDLMFEQKFSIYVSEKIANKIGLDFSKGDYTVQTKEQLEKLKNFTVGIASGGNGYTLYYDDKSRTSYNSNGVLEYYESQYNAGFPVYGMGNAYGLKDGDISKIIDVINIIQIGTCFIGVGAGASKATSRSIKITSNGSIRLEKGVESVSRSVQKELGVKFSGSIQKPWHLVINGKEIPVNPFNPNWRYFRK